MAITRRLTRAAGPARAPLTSAFLRVVLAAAPVLAPISTASAQTPAVMVGVFTTPAHDNAPPESPWGVVGSATFDAGAGVEARWAKADSSTYWSLGFTQILPGPKHTKTLQPFASIGAGQLRRHDDEVTCLHVAGGAVLFLGGPVGVGFDFRYLRGLHRLDGEHVSERHVSLAAFWRF